MTTSARQQSRRDTAANWTSANPTLLSGELGYETDTKHIKIGDGATAWTSLPYVGVLTRISTQTLGSAAATIDFTSIPSTYTHLQLVYLARSSLGSTAAAGIRFNNDSTAIYDLENTQNNNTTAPQAAGTVAATSLSMAIIPWSTSGANVVGSGVVDIPFYAQTTFYKNAHWRCFSPTGTAVGDMRTHIGAGQWRSQAAISRITLFDTSGGNLITGSSATLYGLG